MRYDFEEQDKVEARWIPLAVTQLTRWFGELVLPVRHHHLPFDLIVGDMKCDVKADTRMGRTGNFFLETESVKGRKQGWLYNTGVHFILYIDDAKKLSYVLPIGSLRAHERDIKKFPYREIENDGWVTCGHLVPVHTVLKWVYESFRDYLKNQERKGG